MARPRSDRQTALAQLADDEGLRWAKARIGELEADGRLPEGGWPGTLTEARAHVAYRGRLLEMTAAESTAAARRVYEVARRAWTAATKPARDRPAK